MASQNSGDQPPPAEDVRSRVENDISGIMSGNSVQAGAISGGVHFYAAGAATAGGAASRDKGPGAVARVWKIFWGWLGLLTLLFLVSGLLSYVINSSVGRGSWRMNLAADLFLLCVAAVALVANWRRTASRKVSLPACAGAAIDWCTPRCVKNTNTSILCIIGILDGFFVLAAFGIKEAEESFTGAQGKNGVLILFGVLGVFVGRTLLMRWKGALSASAE